jgi:hypothetical protein
MARTSKWVVMWTIPPRLFFASGVSMVQIGLEELMIADASLILNMCDV